VTTSRQTLDTCEIVWWSGYVRGRFQAFAVSPSGVNRLIGESPQIRWHSTSPPGPTQTAVAALEALMSRLAEAGWIVASRSDERWFGLVLSRPVATVGPRSRDAEADRDHAPGVRTEPQLDSALLAELHSALKLARRETELERGRRIDAESRASRLVALPPTETTLPHLPRRQLLLAAYAIAVAGAAAIFLFGFHSLYAAIVAALTTAAVSLAADSWLVAHRRMRMSLYQAEGPVMLGDALVRGAGLRTGRDR
jgi:hypothetical protein